MATDNRYDANIEEEMDDSGRLTKQSIIAGGIALAVSIISFVGQTVITREIQESFEQPFFILWVSHSFWIVLLPLHALYERITKRRNIRQLKSEVMEVNSRLILQRQDYRAVGAEGSQALANERPKWVMWQTCVLAVLLAGLLNTGAYLWYVSVGLTSMAKVTAIYNASCVFAYIFSVWLLREGVSAGRIAAVVVSMAGVGLMALGGHSDGSMGAGASTDEEKELESEILGDVTALASACGIGLYQVLYKKYAVPRGKRSLFHVDFMTSLLGLCTMFIFWIPIPLLHISKIERFHWPNGSQMALIGANALCGVAYNGGFMIALALTSPLFAAVGVMLTIPVMAAVDMMAQHRILAWNVLGGAAAVLAGFALLTLAELHAASRRPTR